jgi:anti-sigma B factor antagonist
MVAGLVASAMAGESADGPFRLVELVGEADLTSRQLKDVLDAEVAAGPALLVVDMSRLTFMDAGALQVILAAWRRLREAGGVMVLASPSGPVRRILELTGADELVGVYGTVQEAAAG